MQMIFYENLKGIWVLPFLMVLFVVYLIIHALKPSTAYPITPCSAEQRAAEHPF